MFPTISSNPAIQARYLELRDAGESHSIAEMLAAQQAPGLCTDDTFFAGCKNEENITEDRAVAFRRKGISTAGKKYMAQLARFPNDPEALVSTRGEIQALLARRNWGCSGQITASINRDVVDVKPTVVLDEQIVTDEVEMILADNPEVAPTPKEKVELANKIREKRKPHPKVSRVW